MDEKHEIWLDSIDYYALERAYRILGILSSAEKISEELEKQLDEWFMMDTNVVEKDMALRMVFERERHRRVISDEELDRYLRKNKDILKLYPNSIE